MDLKKGFLTDFQRGFILASGLALLIYGIFGLKMFKKRE